MEWLGLSPTKIVNFPYENARSSRAKSIEIGVGRNREIVVSPSENRDFPSENRDFSSGNRPFSSGNRHFSSENRRRHDARNHLSRTDSQSAIAPSTHPPFGRRARPRANPACAHWAIRVSLAPIFSRDEIERRTVGVPGSGNRPQARRRNEAIRLFHLFHRDVCWRHATYEQITVASEIATVSPTTTRIET